MGGGLVGPQRERRGGVIVLWCGGGWGAAAQESRARWGKFMGFLGWGAKGGCLACRTPKRARRGGGKAGHPPLCLPPGCFLFVRRPRRGRTAASRAKAPREGGSCARAGSGLRGRGKGRMVQQGGGDEMGGDGSEDGDVM